MSEHKSSQNLPKVVILCGGKGTRLQEATGGVIPKPMVRVGGRPILWHIMKMYAHHGCRDFVLCLGHLGTVLREYFLNYKVLNSDVTIHLGSKREHTYHGDHGEIDWNVTLVDTGANAMTGSRVARVEQYVEGQTFCLTYGDGVSDIDVTKLLAFHRGHGKLVTVTGVRPVGRFGRLNIQGDRVVEFEEKPIGEGAERINGGFFVMEPQVMKYLDRDSSCILERDPLEQLARDQQLMVYQHDGFWQCMDTFRDLQLLESVWERGDAPWRTW